MRSTTTATHRGCSTARASQGPSLSSPGRGCRAMRGRVHGDFARPDPVLVSQLRLTSVATLHDVLAGSDLMDPGIRPLVPGQHAVGPAVTALCADGDNLAMHVALASARAGDVLV